MSKYKIGDEVAYMAMTVTKFGTKRVLGVNQMRMGIVKSVRRSWFGRKYTILRYSDEDETKWIVDIVRERDIFEIFSNK